MRIVLFSTRFAFEYSIELANALHEQTEVEKVFLFLPNNKVSDIQREQINKGVVYLPYYLAAYKQFFLSNKVLFKVIKKIKKIKPDILHIQGSAHPYFWFFYPMIRKIPIVDTVHDPQPHPGFGNILQTIMRKSGARFSKRWFVHGEKLKKQFVDIYDINENHVKVIPKGHYEIFKNYSTETFEEEDGNILFFGNITKYKGIDVLIKSSKQVINKYPNVKFLLAGKTRKKDNIDLSGLSSNKNFVLMNYRIPEKEVSELFQRASIIILPYIEASQSGVLSIAYGYGKAIIVTDVGSLPEIIENNKTGLVVESNNNEALSNAIIRLLSDDDYRKNIGENAYKYAKKELSWNSIAEQICNVYKELV